jgi:arylsulfatase A-like enzyme
VLFILIDTLRADRVGGDLTPFLDEIAAHAIVYDRAHAPSSWTIPSVASLFVGQLPFEHGMLDFGDRLPGGATTLAEVLARHGFDTAAFTASGVMAAGDFERGFGTYRVVGHPGFVENPDATEVNAAALAWLDHRDGARPFFLYLHYMEPHAPYRPHVGFTAPPSPDLATDDETLSFRASSAGTLEDAERRRSAWDFSPDEVRRLEQLYDGEVGYLDRRLAVLFDALRDRGALRRTIVVVTADHGEEFGEHGLFAHGVSLYEPVLRVPLLVRLPDAHGVRVGAPVQTAGLAPALLGALGITVPSTFRVAPIPLGAGENAAPVVSQLGPTTHFAVRAHRAAVVDGDRKLVVTPTDQPVVYDLRADPGEQTMLLPSAADRRRAAASDLSPPGTAVRTDRAALPDDMLRRLRALGYVGEDGRPSPRE